MTVLRFSLRWLLAAVAFVAIACAALKYATPTSAKVVVTLTIAMLVAAPLAIAYRASSRRAFSFGFALFGWAYLTFAMGPWFGTNLVTRDWLNAIWIRLVKAPTVESVREFIPSVESIQSSVRQGEYGGQWLVTYVRPDGSTDLVLAYGSPFWEALETSGQSLLTILAALFGGLVGKWFCMTNGSAAVLAETDRGGK